jgi:hypothetical protein
LRERAIGRFRLRFARGERLEEEVAFDRLQPSPVASPAQKQVVNAAVVRLDIMRDHQWNEAGAFEQGG